MKTDRKILGTAAAAAAAAATAVGVVVARRRGEPETWHVRPHDEGWIVTKDGVDDAASRHGTKKEAVSAARRLAARQAPSELVLHYADGRVQKRLEYAAD